MTAHTDDNFAQAAKRINSAIAAFFLRTIVFAARMISDAVDAIVKIHSWESSSVITTPRPHWDAPPLEPLIIDAYLGHGILDSKSIAEMVPGVSARAIQRYRADHRQTLATRLAEALQAQGDATPEETATRLIEWAEFTDLAFRE